MALFKLGSVLEGVAHTLANFKVAEMYGVEGQKVHLLQVGLAVLGKVFLIYSDIQNLGHDVVARLRLVNLPLNAALHRHREVSEYGSVYLLALLDFPAGLCHLILYFLSADNA